jgi:2-phospho-L-lactate guanylyltransferase
MFSPQERRALSLAMLEDVVRAALALDAVWVLNSDDDAAETAVRAGADPRPDPTPGEGLNASLNAATAEAVKEGARGVLILSADCAAATTEDVRAISLGEGVMLAPDRFGIGTNALWRQPPDAIEAEFGGHSCRAHIALAHVSRVPLAIVPRPRLAIDVDSPRDLSELWRIGPGASTRTALEALGYPSRRR